MKSNGHVLRTPQPPSPPPHRRSCWAGTQRGKGVAIQGLKRGERAATGVIPHGGSAVGVAERPLEGALTL